MARMTLRLPGNMFYFLTVSLQLPSIIANSLESLPPTSWKEASLFTGLKESLFKTSQN